MHAETHTSLYLLSTLAISTLSFSAEPDGSRVGLGGYDPVSYFTQGKPERGVSDLSARYDNVTYWFRSDEHRNLFVKNPDGYAPRFSGYCAIDLSRGLLTEPDPEAWTIADGKLYVFGKKRGPSVFAEERQEIVAKAAQNWRDLQNR